MKFASYLHAAGGGGFRPRAMLRTALTLASVASTCALAGSSAASHTAEIEKLLSPSLTFTLEKKHDVQSTASHKAEVSLHAATIARSASSH